MGNRRPVNFFSTAIPGLMLISAYIRLDTWYSHKSTIRFHSYLSENSQIIFRLLLPFRKFVVRAEDASTVSFQFEVLTPTIILAIKQLRRLPAGFLGNLIYRELMNGLCSASFPSELSFIRLRLRILFFSYQRIEYSGSLNQSDYPSLNLPNGLNSINCRRLSHTRALAGVKRQYSCLWSINKQSGRKVRFTYIRSSFVRT